MINFLFFILLCYIAYKVFQVVGSFIVKNTLFVVLLIIAGIWFFC